jgi:uncharacterized delta-60 repeat protein
VITDVGFGSSGTDVAVQRDGKIVVAGLCSTELFTHTCLARYNRDLSLDSAFGVDGVSTEYGSDQPNAVALKRDGRIVTAGTCASANFRFCVARYDSDGSLDGSFGTDGRADAIFGSQDFAYAVAIESDGQIIAAGGCGGIAAFCLARFDGRRSDRVGAGDHAVVRFHRRGDRLVRCSRQLPESHGDRRGRRDRSGGLRAGLGADVRDRCHDGRRTATNSAGNSAHSSFTVKVKDTTPPTVAVPSNISVSTSNSAGTAVSYAAATASDLVDGPLTPVCTPTSGSTFPVGTTTVNCTATDAHGNAGHASFTVTVTLTGDTTRPTLRVPANITKEATGPAGAVVTYTVTATDPDNTAAQITILHLFADQRAELRFDLPDRHDDGHLQRARPGRQQRCPEVVHRQGA